MTRKSICLLFLVLLALPCFAASKYESKITSLEGEKWWGGGERPSRERALYTGTEKHG